MLCRGNGFRLSKIDRILEKRNKITIRRNKDLLNLMLYLIQILKQQTEQAKFNIFFTSGESEENIGDWGKPVKVRVAMT